MYNIISSFDPQLESRSQTLDWSTGLMWSTAPKHSLRLLGSIQKRAVRLIGDPRLTRDLDSLEHRRMVADLTLFYRYFDGRISIELAACVPPKAAYARSSRQSMRAHSYTVKIVT